MPIYETMSGGTNDFTALMHVDEADAWTGKFKPNGMEKNWPTPPIIQPLNDKRRKKQKPQADIGHLVPGAFVLNEKACTALREFLQPFGQLLPVLCGNETKYYYNVTKLISVIDEGASEKLQGGTAIIRARFHANAIPSGVHIFKDPITANARIYLTTEAKEAFEKIVSENMLSGLIFFAAGEEWY